MILRKYISVMLFVLALLALSQQQVNIPNQEIVVQFTNVELSSVEAKNTIDLVKTNIKSLGVSEIQVAINDDSSLKITYFSKLDAAIVRNLLVNKGLINSKNTPDEQNDHDSFVYNLDVFDIRKPSKTEGDFQGIVLDLKSDSDRFQNPKKYKPSPIYNSKESNGYRYETSSNSFSFESLIQNTSCKVPEARAGPAA